jgi:hypothetical protein
MEMMMTEQQAPYGDGAPQSPINQILARRDRVRAEHPGWQENARGELVREENLKPEVGLRDTLTVDLFATCCAMSTALQALVEKIEAETLAFRQLAAEKYGLKPRGSKGNYSLESADGLIRIDLNMGCLYRIDGRIADAKEAVHRCIERWGQGADPNLLSLASSAFSETEGGQLSRSRLGMLLEFEPAVPDAEWDAAMRMIRESIQIAARKRAIVVKWRPDQRAPWIRLPLSTIAAEAIAAGGAT